MSRTLKPKDINYGTVKKEMYIYLNYGCVLSYVDIPRYQSGYSIFNLRLVDPSSGLNGRLGRWAALLSNWNLEVRRCEKGEDEILGTFAASITTRSEVDDMLIAISPKMQPRLPISIPPHTVEEVDNLLVISFDGSAWVKRKSGAYRAIVWKLPEWTIVAAALEYAMYITVNVAEYSGLLLGLDLLDEQTRGWIIICGDSNLVIRPIRGKIDCKAPELQLLRHKAMKSSSRGQITCSYI